MNRTKAALNILLLLAASSLGCSSKEEINGLEITVVKDFRFEQEAIDNTHRIYTTVMDSPVEDELAFSNYISPASIIIIDYDGNFIEKIGRQGRGPDEIQSARYFGFDNHNNLVVLDKEGAFFKHFNRETGEVSSFNYEINKGISVDSRNLEACGDKWYFGIQDFGKPTSTDTPTIGVFDSTFTMIDSFGGYDPFYEGRRSIMRETNISVDCEAGLIYTTQSKVPYVQVYSIEDQSLISRIDKAPSSFMISNRFITMVTNMNDFKEFMTEEQSLSLLLAHSEKYIYQIFRNDRSGTSSRPGLNERDHFVAVYDKANFELLGEAPLPGAVLGSTKDGQLIMLKDESEYHFQFIEVIPMHTRI